MKNRNITLKRKIREIILKRKEKNEKEDEGNRKR
jgi:hypothetical protein